jgi:large subunit ribosomal protein L25
LSGQDIAIKVEERTVLGKGVRQLRRDGIVPAVIHDHGKESKHVMGSFIEMTKVYQAAGKHHPVNVTLGSKKYMALIKDVDFEPRKHTVRHVVFNAIAADEKQQTEVPINFIEGEIPAEKAGYMVIRQLDVVEIEALPKDLIDQIEIDASSLVEIGDKLTVADIVVPKGVEILTESEHPIAVVEETKAQMSERR